ncbi:hypothetical protein HDV00_000212 [Rhizophlyctis rosea]|nr:hypothetical protein HDV00_000212 [Rhizophlyctis rosea]
MTEPEQPDDAGPSPSANDAFLTPEALAAGGWELESTHKQYYVHASGWCYHTTYGHFYFDEDGNPIYTSQDGTASSAVGEAEGLKDGDGNLPVPGDLPLQEDAGELEEGEIVDDADDDNNNTTHPQAEQQLSSSEPTYPPTIAEDPPIATWPYDSTPHTDSPSLTASGYAIPTSDLSMKLVVLSTSLTTIKLGDIVLVDGSGLTIGRDRSHEKRLRLNEMAVSRFHASIFVERAAPGGGNAGGEDLEEGEGEGDGEAGGGVECFCIVDAGSTQGTFVDGVRLSEPKKSSTPHPLPHRSLLTIGSTTFQIHCHSSPTSFITSCEGCQVTSENVVGTDEGVVKQETTPVGVAALPMMTTEERKEALERERRSELKRIRRGVLGDEGRGRGKKRRKGGRVEYFE